MPQHPLHLAHKCADHGNMVWRCPCPDEVTPRRVREFPHELNFDCFQVMEEAQLIALVASPVEYNFCHGCHERVAPRTKHDCPETHHSGNSDQFGVRALPIPGSAHWPQVAPSS